MRFSKLLLNNSESIKTKLEIIDRAISNNSMTAEEIQNLIKNLISLTENNISFIEREINEN